jgi:hypothetical protein
MKKTYLTLIALFAAMQFSYAQWTNATNIYNTNTGNVGIGTTNPTRLLDIVSSSGVGPLKVSGPAGSLLIDNVGSGESYYQANSFHQFQGTSGAPILTMLGGGNVGIGTTSPDEKLTVNGTIHAKEVMVDVSIPVPDYVFDGDYKLTDLDALKIYITKNHHLPDVPSATQMEKEGINLSVMNTTLLKKVEELTLYLIQKDEQLKEQEKVNQLHQEQIDELKKQLDTITKSMLNK